MKILKLLLFPAALAGAVLTLAAVASGLLLALAWPNLPTLETLTDYQPKIPLRVYSSEGVLLAEFGEERRSIVGIREVPVHLKSAILAAEDERFYEHPGIDWLGVLRAAYTNLVERGRRQGASTITMQVARNFFLSSEKTLTRKLYEVLLALKIEQSLSKDQILELYINQIYLGQRAYGFAAAAQTYFGKSLSAVTLAEAAMLAGLPKAPSTFNPVANPQRARVRQLYVLRRMRELGAINDAQLQEAQKVAISPRRDLAENSTHADYLAEMVRLAIFERFPNDLYSRGLRVYTTIRKADQDAAYASLRKGVLDYDRSQGYRGPEGYEALPEKVDDDAIEEALSGYTDADDLLAALVLSATSDEVQVATRYGMTLTINGEGLKFAARALDAKANPQRRIRRGSIVRIQRDVSKRWSVVQLPEAEGSFLAVDPQNGAIRALVGGFDFQRNKFNHVTQAWRQPGSSFKPFIYSAALEKGFTPATVVADEPLAYEASVTGSQRWEPKNYDGKFDGPMRLRTALAKSKNMVSIRVLESISPRYAQDYVSRFGFDSERHPPYLTMALGAGSVTAMQMARAYGVFANGGYLVEPYFIQRIVDDRGNSVATSNPPQAGNDRARIIDARNAFVMDSMLQDVTRYGTAARAAQVLKRRDIAGKTGTTNDFIDAWFAGYHPSLVGVAWVGFDQPRSLGRNQTGGSVALPIWIGFMERALKDVPESVRSVPDGVISVETGLDPSLPSGSRPGSEFFFRENVPGNSPLPGAAETEVGR